MMHWVKSSQLLPNDGDEVLLHCEGTVYIGIYNKAKKVFVLRNGKFCDPRKSDISWTEILRPGKSDNEK